MNLDPNNKDTSSELSQLDETSLLVIILDTNPGQRVLRENPHFLTQYTDSVIAFANAHLMQKAHNKLAVMACHSRVSEFIYPVPGKPLDIRQVDGQYEVFTLVEKTVKQNLAKVLTSESSTIYSESLLSGAVAMALCYIARIQRIKPPGCKVNSRILVITGSGNSASQYMNYMNVFFTAQKQGVVIDVCTLDQQLSLLQQGCDITNGLYLKVPQIQGLLQYLLWVFLPEPPIRQKLVLPPPVKVDYRAACFCHRELIDVGYVCSVCLSIFCKFSPICTTCHTVFKIPGPLAAKSKKKKIKL
ncbi:general transcription factor IIH subunit 3 isoform X2 [Onthophagus taurus]|uniref:general transcription factor IIH subunit 3 isoform X2 n=1 Tax=Onthophagus taurus TaxID=166361 RepID=UPI000C20A139|nr:general transcription factor IIH subunit 3 [Onthophagus taurus]